MINLSKLRWKQNIWKNKKKSEKFVFQYTVEKNKKKKDKQKVVPDTAVGRIKMKKKQKFRMKCDL